FETVIPEISTSSFGSNAAARRKSDVVSLIVRTLFNGNSGGMSVPAFTKPPFTTVLSEWFVTVAHVGVLMLFHEQMPVSNAPTPETFALNVDLVGSVMLTELPVAA